VYPIFSSAIYIFLSNYFDNKKYNKKIINFLFFFIIFYYSVSHYKYILLRVESFKENLENKIDLNNKFFWEKVKNEEIVGYILTTQETNEPAFRIAHKPILLRTITKTVNIDLPDLAITVWYRTDGSGTSENFTKWLKANNDLDGAAYWNRAGNTTFTSSTPIDIATKFNFQGASGSSLVAKNAAGKPGSITYSELEWAKLNKLAVANVKNRAGEYVSPSSAATAVFLGAATINANGTLSYDFTKSIPGAYSLGIASYAMVYPEASKKDAAKQKIVKDFLSFVVEGCHAKFPDQGFTQLSGPLLAKAKEQLALIK
jgi:phosphate transport system substrate-binding protein